MIDHDVSIKPSLLRTFSRVMLSIAVLAMATMGLLGVGASATFNDSKVVSHSVGTGSVTLTLGTNNTAANRLSVNATALAPLDTVQRSINLINGGTLDWSTIALTTAATTSTVLDTDTTNGLQLTVDECSQAWTEAGTTPNFTYTCGGTTTNSVTSRPVVGSNINLGGRALTAGQTGYYRITMTLPSTADNTFMSRTSTIQYTFTGTSRLGTNK